MDCMKLSSANVTFTSKPEVINEARKVMHIITSDFAAVSGTKISEFKCAQGNNIFQSLAARVNERIKTFIRTPFWEEYMKRPAGNYYQTLVENIQKYRVANCADFAKLWNLLAKLNKIESKPAELHLVSKDGMLKGGIDHAIHIINLRKNADLKCEKLSKMKDVLIVDPWLGFVDYAPNAERKFKYDFGKLFKIPEDCDVMLNPYAGSAPEVTESMAEFFKKNFPQFFIKK